MSGLRLKIPPPIVALATAFMMWVVDRALPALTFAIPGRGAIAGGLAGVGVLVAVLGVVSFRRARTTLNPMTPGASSALVTRGIFGRTRNPMYLGLVVFLLAWAVFLSNFAALVLIPLFIVYINVFQIGPEELALGSLFGEDFIHYRSRVRRWV
jgi:protein-S-isoprenylcysteine O-methyltransferase Ste14